MLSFSKKIMNLKTHYLQSLNVTCGSSFLNQFFKSNRYLYTSYSLQCKETRGNMMKSIDAKEYFKKLRDNPQMFVDSFYQFPKECGKFYKEIADKDIFKSHWGLVDTQPGDINMIFPFETEEDFKLFSLTTDQDSELGYSTAKFEYTQNKTALVTGNLSTVLPKHVEINRTGFVNITCKRKIKSFQRPGFYNWSEFTHLVLKIRGDGRPWSIILSTPYRYVETYSYQFCHPLYTRGGPYWQITKIPFNNFFYTYQNQIAQTDKERPPLDKIAMLGFTLSDNKDGPFKLEIDYIGALYEPGFKHATVYESYR